MATFVVGNISEKDGAFSTPITNSSSLDDCASKNFLTSAFDNHLIRATLVGDDPFQLSFLHLFLVGNIDNDL
jgi:hypothetical protein